LTNINIKETLTKYKTVAVLGLSKDPRRDSYRVAEYLKKHGFKIIPVNPTAVEILGEKSYKRMLEIPAEIQKTIEIVDVFRPSEEVMSIVEQVIKMKEWYDRPYVIWMQLGIIDEKAAALARKSGLKVVMDHCMMREHKKLFSNA
jgi:predicted CoA-binding protein